MGRLEVLDIVFDLTSIGAAKADDPSRVVAIDKCHVVEGAGFWGEGDHSRLAVVKPRIDPHQRSFPVEFTGKSQRHAVLGLVREILGWVELDTHALL